MYPLKGIAEALPAIAADLARRGEEVDVEGLLALDAARRERQAAADELRRRAKEKSGEVASAAPEDRAALVEEARALADECKEAEAGQKEAKGALEAALLALPNRPDPATPDGLAGEVTSSWGEARPGDTPHHDEIAADLGLVDMEAGAALSGSGWPLLVGRGARLARAIGSWMVDSHVEAGWTEVSPPLAVGSAAMTGSGQLPKFADQAYRLERDDLWLIPTSEVALVNYLAAREIAADDLPVRLTALTPNFRREAGSHGSAVRGLVRQHQFEKVELVSAVSPGTAQEEIEVLLGRAEGVLRDAGLPHRRVRLGAADLAFPSALTYDLEIPMPSDGRWMEISSVSSCGDFQARRAGVLYRPAGGKPAPPHLLNGTAVAVGRLLAALLEHGWREDGSVSLPEPLAAALGTEVLSP